MLMRVIVKLLLKFQTLTNIPEELKEKMHKHAYGRMKALYHLPLEFPMIEKYAFIQNFKSFVFVRHPFIRLVSTFRDKIIQHQYKNFRTRVHYKNDAPIEKLFRTFVSMVLNGKFGDDPHTDFYYHECDMCRINYDIIGKVETFKDDMEYIIQFVRAIS